MALSQGKMTTEPKVPFQQQPSLSASACLTPGGGESLCCLLSMNKLKPLPLVYVNNTCEHHSQTCRPVRAGAQKCHTDRRRSRNNDPQSAQA